MIVNETEVMNSLKSTQLQAPEITEDEESPETELPAFLCVPNFCAQGYSPVSYVNVNHLTTSDVMSTTVTTTVDLLAAKKKSKFNRLHLPFQRSPLPAVIIPAKRMNKRLLKERKIFMRKLKQEQEDKLVLEDWAVRKIQHAFVSFQLRPKPSVSFKPAKKRNTLHHIRADLDIMKKKMPDHILSELSESKNLAGTPEWRKSVAKRASGKYDAKRHKEKLYSAASKIQSVIRGYIARIGFYHIFERHADEVYLQSIVKIQCLYRGYTHRKQLFHKVSNLRTESAIQIQSLVRGVLHREIAGLLKLELCDSKYEACAATTLQTLIRGKQARKRATKKREHNAIVKIQKLGKGHMTRIEIAKKTDKACKFKKVKEFNLASVESNDAAIKLQALVRGRQSRNKVSSIRFNKTSKERDRTAIKAQAFARGRKEREEGKQVAKDYELAVIKVQKLTRGHQERQKQTHSSKQATKIQSVYRGNRVRRSKRT